MFDNIQTKHKEGVPLCVRWSKSWFDRSLDLYVKLCLECAQVHTPALIGTYLAFVAIVRRKQTKNVLTRNLDILFTQSKIINK